MKRKGWAIPILVFFISLGILFSYQKLQDVNSLAATTDLPPILWSKAPSDITKILIQNGEQTIEAYYENDTWYTSKPSSMKADSLYIYNLLTPFVEPNFDTVVEDEPADLTIYGISDASPSITLYDKDEHEYTLIKGKNADNTSDYVYSPLSHTVYTMQKTAFSNISTDTTKWRAKELFTFNAEDVTKITLNYNHKNYALFPKSTDEGLIFTSDYIESNKATAFVSFLETSKVENFITDSATAHTLKVYGFNTPSASCVIYFKTGKHVGITFGNILKDEGLMYAQLTNTTGIAALSYFDFDNLTTSAKTASASSK